MKRILLSVVAIVALLAMIACGGGGSSSTPAPSPTPTPSPSSANVSLNVGDAAADRLVAFEATVSSVTLTGASGPTANLLTQPAKIELTHLSGKFEPLRLTSVPAGSYTGASFTLTAAEAVIIPLAGGAPAEKNVPVPTSPITITFSSPVTVGSTASVLNFDFNLAAIVTVTGDTVAIANPIPANALTIVVGQAGAKADDQAEDEDGELEDIHGTVGTVNASSFTLNLENNSQVLTFNVDSTTECSDGLSGAGTACLATMKQGMVVKVEGVTKADGSLLAKEIEGSETETGMEAEGIITNTTPATGQGVTVTSVQIVVHESTSSQTAQPAQLSTITITLPTNASAFRVDLGHGKTAVANQNLLFDAGHIGKGQKIEADEDVAGTDNLTAKKIKLKKQALNGIISAMTSTGFTLALPSDSFFTQLTGETSINVITPGGMILKGTAPSANQTIRVRGLLFFDPSASAGTLKYTMVAGRTDHPDSH